jgi:hypothetical protein
MIPSSAAEPWRFCSGAAPVVALQCDLARRVTGTDGDLYGNMNGGWDPATSGDATHGSGQTGATSAPMDGGAP